MCVVFVLLRDVSCLLFVVRGSLCRVGVVLFGVCGVLRRVGACCVLFVVWRCVCLLFVAVLCRWFLLFVVFRLSFVSLFVMTLYVVCCLLFVAC